MTSITTIKLPVPLRDRLRDEAATEGVSTAALLGRLLDDMDRRRRMAEVGRAFATLDDDADYWSEAQEWDAISAGGDDA